MKLGVLSKLKDMPQVNINYLVVLPVILIIAVVAGDAYFFVTNTNPALQANNNVGAELDKSRNALAAPGRIPATNPNVVRTQLASVKATVAASLNVFLSDDQANNIINTFSQYAISSGVQVLSIQSQPATTAKDLYTATVIKLQVQGDSHNLVEFASRIKDPFSAQGLVINNIALSNGDTPTALMTLDIALYTTSFPKSSSPVVNQTQSNIVAPSLPNPNPPPLPLPTATALSPTQVPILPTPSAIPPTATPVYPTAIPRPPFIVYIVRGGDTLYSIAQRYDTSIEALMATNHLTNYNIIVGQALQIPLR